MVSCVPPMHLEVGKIVYTEFYDAGAWAVPNQIGVSAKIVHKSKNQGLLFVDFWNLTERPQTLSVVKIVVSGLDNKSYYFHDIETDTRQDVPVIIEPMSKNSGEAGYAEIRSMVTEIPVQVHYRINGVIKIVKLTLKRRTKEEQRRYFGQKGTPPYPWSNILK